MTSSPRVLIVVTSHAQLGATGKPTGLWLEELAVPYRVFRRANWSVVLASPQGGKPPLDPGSEKAPSAEVRAFLDDSLARAALAETLPLARAAEDSYDAVFVAGGHGVMWDLPRNAALGRILEASYARGVPVAAVCHGSAALVGVRKPDGSPLVAGHLVTGFSDEEERAVGLDTVVPFAVAGALKAEGGRYENGPAWGAFVRGDTRLITGQNPASSAGVAEAVVAAVVAAAT